MRGRLPYLADIVLIALNTGMRKSEILGLKKSDIFLKDISGYILLKDTKNNDVRKVPLNYELTILFNGIIKNVSDYNEYLFTNRSGKPFIDIKKGFHKTCERAGIKGLTFHDLRHTFCTRAAQREELTHFLSWK